jgi:hypothetical protein
MRPRDPIDRCRARPIASEPALASIAGARLVSSTDETRPRTTGMSMPRRERLARSRTAALTALVGSCLLLQSLSVSLHLTLVDHSNAVTETMTGSLSSNRGSALVSGHSHAHSSGHSHAHAHAHSHSHPHALASSTVPGHRPKPADPHPPHPAEDHLREPAPSVTRPELERESLALPPDCVVFEANRLVGFQAVDPAFHDPPPRLPRGPDAPRAPPSRSAHMT